MTGIPISLLHGRDWRRRARPTLFTVGASLLLLLGGCLYRPDVQQGNQLTAEMIAEVEPGMTRREVVRILGYPLVNDPFNQNRWDYFYSFKAGRSDEMIRHSVKLTFEGDYLSTIESDIPEEDSAAEADSD